MPVTLDQAGNVVTDNTGSPAAAMTPQATAPAGTLITLSTHSKWWPVWAIGGVIVGYLLFAPQARKFFR